jgi:hypothetical protein
VVNKYPALADTMSKVTEELAGNVRDLTHLRPASRVDRISVGIPGYPMASTPLPGVGTASAETHPRAAGALKRTGFHTDSRTAYTSSTVRARAARFLKATATNGPPCHSVALAPAVTQLPPGALSVLRIGRSRFALSLRISVIGPQVPLTT